MPQNTFKPCLESLESRIALTNTALGLGELAGGAVIVGIAYGEIKGDNVLGGYLLAVLGIGVMAKGGADLGFPAFENVFDHIFGISSAGGATSPIAINSFTVTPSNPTSSQTVTAAATVSGAPTNTPVTLSVKGTDGFTKSSTVTITGTGTVTLQIPPGAPGVQDTITLTVPGLPVQQKQVVYS